MLTGMGVAYRIKMEGKIIFRFSVVLSVLASPTAGQSGSNG